MLNFKPTEMTPGKFYSLVKILQSVDDKSIEMLGEFREATIKAAELVQEQCSVLAKANNDMHQEVRTSMRVRNDAFDSLEKQSSDYNSFVDQVSDVNFLLIAYDTVRCIQVGYIGLLDVALNLKPKLLVLSDNKFDTGRKSIQDIQNMTFEFSLNAPAINSFLGALKQLESMQSSVDKIADQVYRSLDTYYRKLLHRHTIEGKKIHKDPVITDVAIMLFKNIDAHGEIAEGKDLDKVSAYTLRKAEILAGALKADSVHKFVQDPGELLKYLTKNLKAFKNAANNLQILFKDQLETYKNTIESSNRWSNALSLNILDKMLSTAAFERTLMLISDVDPRNVSYTESTELLSSDEKFNNKFEEETIEKLADLIANPNFSAEELVKYVLGRKSKLKSYFQDENSFFVTKIGGGNPFTGLAPGALEIIPGPKPNSNLKDIVGSGFDEIKKFIQSVEDASKWNNLFLATSPSKTTDKSNVLLIGPMGCLTGDTFIQYEVRTKDGKRVNHKGGTLERLYQRYNNLPQSRGPKQRTDVEYFAPSINDERRVFQNKINGVIYTGEKECFELKTKNGKTIKATADHEFFVGDKYQRLDKLKAGDSVFVHNQTYYEEDNVKAKKTYRLNKRSYIYVKQHPICGTKKVGQYEYKRLARARAVIESQLNGLTYNNYLAKLNSNEDISNLEFLSRNANVHHKDENILNDEISNLEVINIAEHSRQHGAEKTNVRYIAVEDEIESITLIGIKRVFDVQMAHPYHNVIANNIVVHNCGKTEVFRAVGADKDSISISVQGSDFNTCWKGEMEKNPKRLFEGALKLHKNADKQVHILIDEIDAVLNNDKIPGETNLSLEFQILMDGVISYPKISIWGATNNPERIPMAMIRRFSKCVVVGELNSDNRITLLKHFSNFLPREIIGDDDWKCLADRLEGATGDVIRKMIDHIWREKLSWFIHNKPDAATKMMAILNEETEFELKDFGSKERFNFNQKLGKYFKVSSRDIHKSIDVHLDNIAIKTEIDTAKRTYANAKAFLNQLKGNKITLT